MSKKLLLLTSLAGLPLLSVAQTEPASPHFYVGLGANLLTKVPASSAVVPRLVGPAATGGLHLGPRLALQASLSYHWKNESASYPAYNYGGGTIGGDSYSNSYKYFIVPVLLRYTFTPPAQRFHFDGFVGLTVLHSAFHYESTTTSYTGTPYSTEHSSGQTRAAIALGPAVRYAIGPAVDLTASALVNTVLGDNYSRNFSNRLFLNVLVGAQYSFGQR
jgi:hypothetical protein